MTEIAHAAIDAGADVVIGHGPHYSLAGRGLPRQAGVLRARQLLVPHRAWRQGAWRLARHDGAKSICAGGRVAAAGFRFVRHDAHNRTVARAVAEEGAAFDELARASLPLGARLEPAGEAVRIVLGRA